MKNTIRYSILIYVVPLFLLTFSNCSKTEEESIKDKLSRYLTEKSGGWSLASIIVPLNTATTEDDWMDFKLTVTTTNMNTSGHPIGADAVWPSGSWMMNDKGTTITRGDGVVMDIISLTESKFTVSFIVPDGTEIGGRIAALNGEYIFNLE